MTGFYMKCNTGLKWLKYLLTVNDENATLIINYFISEFHILKKFDTEFFPRQFRDRHQILLLILSKFKDLINLYSPETIQKPCFLTILRKNRS